MKLADLLEENADELAALEALNVGKAEMIARHVDIRQAAGTLRYYGGWAGEFDFVAYKTMSLLTTRRP